MKCCRLILVLSLLICAAVAAAEPAPEHGQVGLSASWQSGQEGIALPIWTSPSFVFVPMLNVTHVSDRGTDFGVGAMFRFNLKNERVTPYFGFRVAGLFYIPEVGDGTTDLLFGPAFGGEYFVGDGFSVSVEAQLNYTSSDEASLRFGNPDGSTLNTATAVLATVYF